MSRGRYVVYERASRDEEELFIQTTKEVIGEIEEPKRVRDSTKHIGGRPVAYSFKPMLLVLLLMVYHRKEYREMEAHPEEFERRYHKRSNAESTNSSFKAKYGEDLHSRTWYMQKREAGLKVITHNIRQLIRFRIRSEIEIWD